MLDAPGKTQAAHNYEDIPGAIPIPATLSLELGRVINEQQQNITYRFMSDYPFANRSPHPLDEFETEALASLRANPEQQIVEKTATLFGDNVRLIAPVMMGAAASPATTRTPKARSATGKSATYAASKRSRSASGSPATSSASSTCWPISPSWRSPASPSSAFSSARPRTIRGMNKELETSNEFLATLSMKISRYLSPQIYKSIFSGEKDVVIQTERKKLTIFFSDIKDFTATTERMQPEQITALLNEYFTEMSTIALHHGGTIDKFVGDAMLVFFGDPETKGEVEDARACVRMAIDMQRRLGQLEVKWRAPASSSRSACAWASTPAIAMSEISAARTAWTTRSSAPRRTSRPGCSRSPSPAAS